MKAFAGAPPPVQGSERPRLTFYLFGVVASSDPAVEPHRFRSNAGLKCFRIFSKLGWFMSAITSYNMTGNAYIDGVLGNFKWASNNI